MKALILILIIAALIVVMPFATIASLNTLFGLAIPFNSYTWLSAAWLSIILTGSVAGKYSK